MKCCIKRVVNQHDDQLPSNVLMNIEVSPRLGRRFSRDVNWEQSLEGFQNNIQSGHEEIFVNGMLNSREKRIVRLQLRSVQMPSSKCGNSSGNTAHEQILIRTGRHRA